MRLSLKLAALSLLATISFGQNSLSNEPQKNLSIVRITPEGEDVESANQIIFEFNRDVVPLGRMERNSSEVPITFSPEIKCNWLWVNPKTLGCNLNNEDELKKATKYQITVKPEIAAEDGTKLDKSYKHSFITKRPDVTYTNFFKWHGAGRPEYRVYFNQVVTKESVDKHIFFNITEGNERIDAVATQNEDYGDHVWFVTPTEDIPPNTKFTVNTEAGIVSTEGKEPSKAAGAVINSQTFPEFKLLGLTCTNNAGQPVLIEPKKTPTEEQSCNPQAFIGLKFSSPVMVDDIKKQLKPTPNDFKGKKIDPWAEIGSYSRLDYEFNPDGYNIPLPYATKAEAEYRIKSKGRDLSWLGTLWSWIVSIFTDEPKTDIQDEFGRKLIDKIDITFKTDARKPNFVIAHNNAVIEKGVDSEVPFYVNNLQYFAYDYNLIDASGTKKSQNKITEVPNVRNVQFAVPFGVRELLKGKSGAVYGSVSTTPTATKEDYYYNKIFAQVTPFQVHAKVGHFSSLVWVTDMKTGKPVPDAKVTFYVDNLPELNQPKEIAAIGKTDANGVANLIGTEKFDPDLQYSYNSQDNEKVLIIRVDKGEDLAILPATYQFKADINGGDGEWIYENNQTKYGHLKSWGTTAQGIYRAGDTIQYKLYVRNQNDKSLVPAPTDAKYFLKLVNPEGKDVETKEITLDEFSSFSGEYKLAQSAPVGWYYFNLEVKSADGEKDYLTLEPIRVLVSDFTPVPFKVNNQISGDKFKAGDEVEAITDAKFHAGGAYTDASARVTATLEKEYFYPENPITSKFYFNSSTPDDPYDTQNIFQVTEKLDEKGELSEKFKIENQKIIFGKLLVESAVQDDRGKYIADYSTAEYFGVDRLVGLRSTKWYFDAGKKAQIEYIVSDTSGKPAEGTDVGIKIEFQEVHAAKVKGAGNAYTTNITREWKEVAKCEGESKKEASVCEFTPEKAGSYRAIASIEDTSGNKHETQLSMWVSGSDYVMWDQENEYFLPITPEKEKYNVGDTAKFMIKNPYPGSYALITVERYGIIDSIVKKLDGSTPIIEIPVKPDYLPGFYLSATVFSPRVDKPLSENQVDMGKPTFKTGYVKIPVKDKYKEITITSKSDHEVYKPREKVKLAISSEMKGTREPIQYAVIVLDEAVLDLVAGGTSYYDPYNGFFSFDDLDMRNFSLLTRLVGRQKFEKKGANPGGDGGADLSMRNLFKFVSYWNPDVAADENGKAEVEFETPDNLTGWRAIVIGFTKTDRLGMGHSNFKVNKPTEIRPVMPNQIGEGDKFVAGFNIMNRTDKKRTLDVLIETFGDTKPTTLEKKVTLEGSKRTTIYLPVEASLLKLSRDAQEGNIKFRILAEDDVDSDRTIHNVPVKKKRELVTSAVYGTTTENEVKQSVAMPSDIYSDVGNVAVNISASVISNLDGAFRYMREYPYICWEQQMTKAVMAAHYQSLKPYLNDLEWEESKDLTHDTLDRAADYQAQNGGMAYYVADDQYVDPYLSAFTAMSFNWLKERGYKVPQDVEDKLHEYLLSYLKTEQSPSIYNDGMVSDVRAVILAVLAKNGEVNKDDIARYFEHFNKMSLFGKSHFLMAASQIAGTESFADKAFKSIMNNANETGGKFVFSEELPTDYDIILTSPERENCVVLDAFLKYSKTADDMPFKMVRTITQTRGNRDAWENTQSNLFCMNALIDYAKKYESEKPDMTVVSYFNGSKFGEGELHDVKDNPVSMEKPIEESDVGKKAELKIEREGNGRLYYSAQISYSPKELRKKDINNGIEIHKEYSVERDGKWVLLKNPMTLKKGELVRVDLYASMPAVRNYVVVNDPVPGGLEPLNRDIANTSTIDLAKGEYDESGGSFYFHFQDWITYDFSRWSFYRQEIRHDAVRFYSDYLPQGNYHLSYMAQAIAEGEFTILPASAEEMYDPEVYGKTAVTVLKVEK